MCRSEWNNRELCCGVLVFVAALGWATAVGAAEPYPEEHRFESKAFYEGLRKRGLTDLLALHLREHPPADAVDALLLARDIKLAQHADPSRSNADRVNALAESNRLLESLIEHNPNGRRTRAWQMELGKSLLYAEADRYTSSILYRGGTAADAVALQGLMERTLAVFGTLSHQFQEEYESLDDLPPAEYDRREGLGEIAKLEQDMALADYLQAWARFYRGISRDADDTERLTDFREVLEYLEDRSHLLASPHSASHHQAQALLLAGMSDRRLGQFTPCRERLGLAIDIVAALPESDNRQKLDWVVTLARIELVRSLSDAGRFDGARQALGLFKRQVESSTPDEFGKMLMVALLERATYREFARRIDGADKHGEADELRVRAVGTLATLARKDAASRDKIYGALYEILSEETEVDSLSPFERSAYLAGALGKADTLAEEIDARLAAGLPTTDSEIIAAEEQRRRVLESAIDVGRALSVSQSDTPGVLRAEARFNLAVAFHRRARRLDAATAFLSVAQHDPEYPKAQDAATFAVQLAWELQEDAVLAGRSEIQELYEHSLRTLTEQFPESESARYWQFFRGQYLAGTDRLEDAADVYARVSPDHERYAEAVYLSSEANAELLKRFAAQNPGNSRAITSRATMAIRAAQDATEQLTRAVAKASSAARRDELHRLAARSKILTAELCVIPRVSRWKRALDTLEGFEGEYPAQSVLIGRVLRTRMIALESLGRVEEASQMIPRYVANDPQGAVPTLQGLFDALREEIERHTNAGRIDQARARAELAVVIAEGIYNVAREQPQLFNVDAVYAVRIQLAEATIESGDHNRAQSLFAECIKEDALRYDDGEPRDIRAIKGSAEARYQLGDYEAALPLFNRVFRGGDQGTRLWWHALLRDLQCRTQLDGDPSGIVKVIQQRRFFDQQMGGADLRRQFDALLETNEKR